MLFLLFRIVYSFVRNCRGRVRIQCTRGKTIKISHVPYSSLVGSFKAKCSKWCSSDKDNKVGSSELDNITPSAGDRKLMSKPTHFINESSSCINLIFSTNASLTTNCGTEASIYEKCHPNII